jgi:hypothetical protein
MFSANRVPAAVTISALASALSLFVSEASAATVVALADGNKLVTIDTDTMAVTGSAMLANGGKLVGFDVRPADGRLYGLTADGAIVIVDPKSGQWTAKSQLSEKLPAGASIAVDFNPVADRMRVIGSDGTSLRVNVEDGKAVVDGRLRYGDSDAGKGKTAKAGAAAYTNSFAGTKETTLYDIDVAQGALVRQVPPNDGILNTVGMIGIKLDSGVAFDIWSDGKGGNAAWILAGGSLYALDLASGAAKLTGMVKGLTGAVMDMAILPQS